MGRTKRSDLPPVTLADRRDFPDQVRRTPNGGWAWTCAYCGRYACDQSVGGLYLCRCHGGSTPRQRSLTARYLHQQATGQVLHPPGRPLRHGLYTRRPTVKISDIVAEYRSRKLKEEEAFRKRCRRLMR